MRAPVTASSAVCAPAIAANTARIRNMDDSMAHPRGRTALWEVPAWKSATGTVAAVLLAIIFLVAGVWKITDPIGAAARLTQAQIPGTLSLPAALLLGIGETFTGV